MANTDRAVAYVDLGVIRENYRTLKAKLTSGVGLLCVVKADAYGHGAVEISRCLESLGVNYLGVANIDEAVELRLHGISSPILVMGGVMPWDEISGVLKYNLTPVVYDEISLSRILAAAKNFERPLSIHLKFDTGMGRLGFMAQDAWHVFQAVRDVTNVHIEGIMSHFASSEVRDDFGLSQIRSFRGVIDVFKDGGVVSPIIHMANSGGIVNYPEAHFSMVRAGISLYGSHASPDIMHHLPTKQAMKFASRIALIRELPSGYGLSYGRTFVTAKRTKVAYIPVGYADGYARVLSNKGSVLVGDGRYSVIGRVCMDWILVDVTGHDEIAVNDEVILLGHSATDAITAEEIAELTGTIPYEIFCNVSKRVPRVYI